MYLRRTRGRALSTRLSEAEEGLLERLEEQTRGLKQQVQGRVAAQSRSTGAAQEARGLWPPGGQTGLVGAALRAVEGSLARVPATRRAAPLSAPVLGHAAELNGLLLLLLLTVLPPQRPRGLFLTTLVGAAGVRTRPAARKEGDCGDPDCCRTACPGNAITRLGVCAFLWVVTHHKQQRHAAIPPQPLSAAAGTHPVLLQLLEEVFQWAHAALLGSFGLVESSGRHFMLRMPQTGQPMRSSSDVGRVLAAQATRALEGAGLPPTHVTCTAIRCV
jgi:hypothetical protein